MIKLAGIHLILLGRRYVRAVGVTEACDYYGGFVAGRVVHDFFDRLSQSPSGHGRELTGHTGDDDITNHRDLSRDNFRLPLVGEYHLKYNNR